MKHSKKKTRVYEIPRSLAIVKKFHPNVKHVVDAKEGLAIEVTSTDVRTSNKKDHKTCAMATACKRKFHLDGVIISRKIAYLVRGNTATRYVLPGSVSREVVAFDRGGSFEPGRYRLSKPAEGMSLSHYNTEEHRESSREYYRNRENPLKHRAPRHFTTNIRASLNTA